MIDHGFKQTTAEKPGAPNVYQDGGGVVYITGNSASGSKYYDLTAPTAPDFGPDPLNPASHWANSVENQEHVRTYVRISAKNDRLIVENLRSGNCAAPNPAVELGNVDWCGPNEGASKAKPIGSKVDAVTIHPDRSISTN